MSETLIIQRLERIERDQKRILNLLAAQRTTKRWMKAHDLLRLTGKDAEWLRQRRIDGLVEWKKEGKSFFYNLDSLPAQLIRHDSNEKA